MVTFEEALKALRSNPGAVLTRSKQGHFVLLDKNGLQIWPETVVESSGRPAAEPKSEPDLKVALSEFRDAVLPSRLASPQRWPPYLDMSIADGVLSQRMSCDALEQALETYGKLIRPLIYSFLKEELRLAKIEIGAREHRSQLSRRWSKLTIDQLTDLLDSDTLESEADKRYLIQFLQERREQDLIRKWETLSTIELIELEKSEHIFRPAELDLLQQHIHERRERDEIAAKTKNERLRRERFIHKWQGSPAEKSKLMDLVDKRQLTEQQLRLMLDKNLGLTPDEIGRVEKAFHESLNAKP